MISFIESIKSDFRLLQLRRTHPSALLYRNVVVDKTTSLEENVVLFPNVNLSRCHIGRFTYIQASSYCHNVEIGPFCSIAFGVVIGLINHPLEYVSTSPIFYDNTQPLPKFLINQTNDNANLARTIIGADVWIGHGAKIMAGVNIGVGAVIGAGAVVIKNVAPYEIVGGVPASTIRYRFHTKTIEELQHTKWWEFSEEKLKKLSPYFSDLDKFLIYARKQE